LKNWILKFVTPEGGQVWDLGFGFWDLFTEEPSNLQHQYPLKIVVNPSSLCLEKCVDFFN